MRLSSYRPIYSQLVDLLAIEILDGTIKVASAMPLVDEMSLLVSMNPQTVIKAYNELESIGAIRTENNKRIVNDDAIPTLQTLLQKRFKDDELPLLAHRLKILGIDPLKMDWDKARNSIEKDNDNG